MVTVETVPDIAGARMTRFALRGLSTRAVGSYLKSKMAQMPRIGGKLAAMVPVLSPRRSVWAVALFPTDQRTLAAVRSMIVIDSGLLAAVGIKFQFSKTPEVIP